MATLISIYLNMINSGNRAPFTLHCHSIITYNEEQIITGYPIDGAMGSLGGGRVQKLSEICQHNAIVARSILVTNIALWDTRTASEPSTLLVLLEPHCMITCLSIYIVELAWRSGSVMDWHATARGSIPDRNGVKTKLQVLCKGQ